MDYVTICQTFSAQWPLTYINPNINHNLAEGCGGDGF